VALSETFRLKTALAKDITSQRQTQMTELHLRRFILFSSQRSAFCPLEIRGYGAVED
jgi:hypothetical protein